MYTLHACNKDGKAIVYFKRFKIMNSALATGSELMLAHEFDTVHVKKNGSSIAVLSLTAMRRDPKQYGRTGL